MWWGIADVELWLQSIDPRVIDAWLAYESIEPEAFEGGGQRSEGGGQRSKGGPMIDAAEAARRMARRMG